MSLQGRWKRTKDEVIEKAMKIYKDLHPELEAKILSALNEHQDLSIADAEKTIRSFIPVKPPYPQTHLAYWVGRGWSEDEGILKARERKLKGVRKTENILSPFSREHWLQKINPETGQNYTIAEADFKRNSIRPIRKEYWMIKGYSEEEAIDLAKSAKAKNNANGRTKASKYAMRTIGYYLVRGYNEPEARLLLKEAQTTFSLEKLIKKHGEKQGTKLWQARQDKWQATLNAKPLEEQERINQAKVWKSGSSSKISRSLFEEIHQDGSRWGKRTETNLGEMMIRLSDKKRAMIDFSFGTKLIEFYGDYWHANPKKYKCYDYIITRKAGQVFAKDIWAQDAKRESSLKSLGYDLHIVWEDDFRTNPEKVIKECKNFLNS